MIAQWVREATSCTCDPGGAQSHQGCDSRTGRVGKKTLSFLSLPTCWCHLPSVPSQKSAFWGIWERQGGQDQRLAELERREVEPKCQPGSALLSDSPLPCSAQPVMQGITTPTSSAQSCNTGPLFPLPLPSAFCLKEVTGQERRREVVFPLFLPGALSMQRLLFHAPLLLQGPIMSPASAWQPGVL